MKTQLTLTKLARIACLTLALPVAIHAEPIPGKQADPALPESAVRADRGGHMPRGAGCGHRHEVGDHAQFMPGVAPGMGIPPYLRNMSLSEVQRDKLFNVMYAQLPGMREQMKLRHSTMKELRALSNSENFDEAKAQQLANQLASLEKDMVLARARTDAKIFAILSPEQRQQLQEESKKWEERRGDQPVNFKQRNHTMPPVRY